MSAVDDGITIFEDDALGAGGAPSGGQPRSARANPSLVLTKSSSFPFFLENVVATGAVMPNASWLPAAWTPCKRGKFYPVSGATEEGEALLVELVQHQREIAESQDFRNPEKLADKGYRSLLSDETTGSIVAAFWDGEYDKKATIELVAAFVPEAELAKLKNKGSLGHLSKTQAVAYLTGYRVPLLVFDDMEALAKSMIDGSYVRKDEILSCADSYVDSFLLCSDADLLEKSKPGAQRSPEAELPGDDAKVPGPLAPPVPQPLTSEQLQKQNEILEAAIQEACNVRDAAARASEAENAYIALAARNLALQQSLAKLNAVSDQMTRVGPRGDPAIPVPLPPGKRPQAAAAPVLRPVDEFLMRTMAEITSNMKAVAEKTAAALPGTTLSPYEKRVKLLDDALLAWGYIPFADYDEESLKELQTRLPSRKSKAFKLIAGELRVNEDDDVADSGSQHMGHWKQGCQFVLARMVTHSDKRVSSQDVLTDRITFFREVNNLSISNGPLKLKTINEFLRRVAVIKAELWMPEFHKNHLLFTEALLSEVGSSNSKKRKGQAQQEDSVNKKLKQDRAKADSPPKKLRQRGAGPAYQGQEKNRLVELSAAERVANGVCPSRLSKSAACPCKVSPKFCTMTHGCPRHPGEFHSAKECNKI
jgi:hypothetical protein